MYLFKRPTGLFRVSELFDTPLISVVEGPILKSFEVVIAISLWFCLVYLDGLYVANYLSKICHDFWADFTTWRNLPEICHWSSVLSGGNSGSIALYRPYWLQWHQLEWQSAYIDSFLVPKRILCWKSWAYSDTISGSIKGIFLSDLKSVQKSWHILEG